MCCPPGVPDSDENKLNIWKSVWSPDVLLNYVIWNHQFHRHTDHRVILERSILKPFLLVRVVGGYPRQHIHKVGVCPRQNAYCKQVLLLPKLTFILYSTIVPPAVQLTRPQSGDFE